jgi:hypothetical protein
VTFDDNNHKDEELYEKALGRRIKASRDHVHAPPSRRSRITASSSNVSVSSSVVSSSKKSQKGSSSASSEDGEQRRQDDSKDTCDQDEEVATEESKSVAFNHKTPESPASSSTLNGLKTQRGQRGRNRDSKVEVNSTSQSALSSTFPATSDSITTSTAPKRRMPLPKQDSKRTKTDDGTEVVKVHLLTGTLYLYRGLHRRAEFVRRV